MNAIIRVGRFILENKKSILLNILAIASGLYGLSALTGGEHPQRELAAIVHFLEQLKPAIEH
jgi:hypothetical protein